LKEYNEDSEDDPSSDEDNDSDVAPELITSREDFESMMDEFLNDYEILGRKLKLKLAGDTGAEKLDTIRRAMGQDKRVRVNGDEDDDNDDDIMIPFEIDDHKDRWDCETILSEWHSISCKEPVSHLLPTATYSNLDNHPRLIRARDPKPVVKILLDPKTGMPYLADPSQLKSKIRQTDMKHMDSDRDSGSDTDTPSMLYLFLTGLVTHGVCSARHTIARSRDESKEEKKARKAAVKAERQSRRADKKATKEQFGAELKVQMRAIGNKEKRLKKL
jgi:protein LTV1